MANFIVTDGFNELRSLMNQDPDDPKVWMDRVCARLLKGYEQDKQLYQDQWLPYLSGFKHHWDRIWLPTLTLKEINAWHTLAPFANFSLNLLNTSVKWSDVHEFFEAPLPCNIKHFALRKSTSSGVQADTMMLIYTSPMLANIESISFWGWSTLTGKYCEMMLKHMPLDQLKTLNLGFTKMSRRALEKVFKDERLGQLSSLSLNEQQMKESSFQALIDAPFAKNLRHLNLDATTPNLSQILNSPLVEDLQTLHLEYCQLTDEHIHDIAQCEALEHLSELHLRGNRLTNQSAEYLAQSPHLNNLKTLDVSRTRINQTGYIALYESAHLPSVITQQYAKFPRV